VFTSSKSFSSRRVLAFEICKRYFLFELKNWVADWPFLILKLLSRNELVGPFGYFFAFLMGKKIL